MIDEKEFRERVSEIESRIPEAFREDPYSYFLSDEERQFFKENWSMEALEKKFDKINAKHLEEALVRVQEDRIKYSADAKTPEEKEKKDKEFDDYISRLGAMTKEELDAHIKFEVMKDSNKENE